MTLPVSQVIKSFGEAQSRLGGGRRGEVRRLGLSLADDLSLSHHHPAPGACLPSSTCSFMLTSVKH